MSFQSEGVPYEIETPDENFVFSWDEDRDIIMIEENGDPFKTCLRGSKGEIAALEEILELRKKLRERG